MDRLVQLVGRLLSELHAAAPAAVCPGDWAWTTTLAGGLAALPPVLGAVLVALMRRFTGNRYEAGPVLAIGVTGLTMMAALPWLVFLGTSEVFRGAQRGQAVAVGLRGGDLDSLAADFCFAPPQAEYLGGARTVREVLTALLGSGPALLIGGALLLVGLPLLALLFVYGQCRLGCRRGPRWPARLLWLPMLALVAGTASLSATVVAHLWLGFLPVALAGMLVVALVGPPSWRVIDGGAGAGVPPSAPFHAGDAWYGDPGSLPGPVPYPSAQHRPAQHVPVQHHPAQHAPAQHAPAQNRPAQHVPAQHHQAQRGPVPHLPAQQVPVHQPPDRHVPMQTAPPRVPAPAAPLGGPPGAAQFGGWFDRPPGGAPWPGEAQLGPALSDGQAPAALPPGAEPAGAPQPGALPRRRAPTLPLTAGTAGSAGSAAPASQAGMSGPPGMQGIGGGPEVLGAARALDQPDQPDGPDRPGPADERPADQRPADQRPARGLAAEPGPLPEALRRALGLAVAPERQPEPPTLPPSRFQRIRPLGSGGFGTVWLAMDTVLDRTVAIKAAKVPDAETERRIRREARALAAVHHPNCVRIYDILTDADGQLAIIMEFVPGRSLTAAVEADGVLADPAAARLWSALAGALHAAHGKGVLHRDVKPPNIVIDEDGYPHLIDFGIARTTGDVTLTAAGMVLGTPDYMAPEVAAGKPAGPAADAWQLAATVSFALAAVPPRAHRDGAIAAMLAAAQGEPCNQLPGRSAHRGLLERSLHPDPARRPTLPAVQAELGQWLAAIGQQPGGPVTERLHGPPAPAWPTEELP